MIVPDWSGVIPVVNGNADSGDTIDLTGLSISAPNGLSHGETITLTTSGTFPTKNQAAPAHWQFGSDIKLNGSAINDEGLSGTPSLSIWESVSDIVEIAIDNLRHPRVNKQYRGSGKGSCTWSKGFDGKVGDQTLYLSHWVWTNADFFRCYAFSYSASSGTFNTNSDLTRGESVTITRTDLVEFSATVLKVDTINNVITLEVPAGLGAEGMAGVDGATVSGLVSSATCTLNTQTLPVASLGAGKTVRVWQDASSNQRTIMTCSNSNEGTIDVDHYDSNNVIDHNTIADLHGVGYPSKTPEQWVNFELEVDFSGSEGFCRQRISNGQVFATVAQPVDRLSSTSSFKLANLGLDTNGTTGISVDSLGIREDFGEIYCDTDLFRVVIGDAPTLDGCSHIELQNPLVWGENIQIQLNQGSFDTLAGRYIFIVGAGFTELLNGAL